MASRANRGRLRLVEVTPPTDDTAVGHDAPASRAPASQDEAGSPVHDGGLAPKPPAQPDTAPPPSTTRHTDTASRTPIPGSDAAAMAGTADRVSSAPAARAQLAALPDAQLVALGCKGETQALEILYRRHAAFAIHLAARIEGSARDVEDIAHDAFVRAFERLNDLTDRSAFRSWLGAIVVHAVRSRMRRARLMSLLGLGKAAEPVDLDALASPEASPHVRAQIAQIYALLRTLPTDDRIAWTLRAVEGHDLETVARLTRCSLATVKRRISRAQHFLDEHFVDAHDTDEEPELPSPPDLPKEMPS